MRINFRIDATTVIYVTNYEKANDTPEDDPGDPNVQGSLSGSLLYTLQSMTPIGTQFMNPSSFSPPDQEHVQPANYSIEPQMTPRYSLSGWPLPFDQNIFAPDDYSEVNGPQMAFLNANLFELPRDEEVSSQIRNNANEVSMSEGAPADKVTLLPSGPPAQLVQEMSAHQSQRGYHAVVGYPPGAQPMHQIPHLLPQMAPVSQTVQHPQSKTSSPPNLCEICGKTFTRRSTLAIHRKFAYV